MGKGRSSRSAFLSATKTFVAEDSGPATKKAEQKAKATGKLDALVDPAGYGAIRRSLPRFEKQDNGLWMMTEGVPVAIETRLDTTGSMGGNVDIAIRVLPDAYELCSAVLPGKDPQFATGIFGDVSDNFCLCRPQFEMTAGKIVEQLTLMVPERNGGDVPEDPHYGLFAAAYLTHASIHARYGLKSYDFTVTDAPARDMLDESHLQRVFGADVFAKVAENGYAVDKTKMLFTEYVVQDLLRHAHSFVLLIGEHYSARPFWVKLFGAERIVSVPSAELIPHVQAVVIGLTEGTLNLQSVSQFLTEKSGLDLSKATHILRAVAHIPIGAQAMLPNFNRLPKAGDLFRDKIDIWPINPEELYSGNLSAEQMTPGEDETGPDWL